MKGKFTILLSFVFTIFLIFSAYAQASPSKVYKLRYADQDPMSKEKEVYTIPWIKSIEEATKGRVKIEAYYAQTLCKGVDAWDALKSGVADIAWCFHAYWPGMTPLSEIVTLPFIQYESAAQASGIMWKLYEKFPVIQKEFKDNHVLLFWSSAPYFWITVNKQIKTLEDIKGLKLRVPGGPPTDMVSLMGGSPVLLPMPDTYLALQKGVIDGMASQWTSVYSFKQYEVAKYHSYAPLFTVFFSIAMSNKVWDKLPEDIQKQITSVSGFDASVFWGGRMFDDPSENNPKLVSKAGANIIGYTIPPEEFSKWQKIAGQPVWDKWLQKMKDKGHTEANQILSTLIELTKTVKVGKQ